TRWPRDWSSDVCSSDLFRIAIYAHPFDHFPRWLARLRRTDDGNGVARSGQRIRFPADAYILRVSLILQQHQDAIIGGRFHKHLFVKELQPAPESDRKSTRLNSSHVAISYA